MKEPGAPPPKNWAGVLFFGTTAAAAVMMLILPPPPPPPNLMRAVTDTVLQNRTRALAGYYLAGVSSLLLLVFSGSLRGLLRAGEPDGDLATTAFGAGVATATIGAASAALGTVLAFSVAEGRDLAVIRAIYDAGNIMFVSAGFLIPALVGATSVSASRSGVLPSWLNAYGWIVVALSLAVPLGAFVREGPALPGGWATLGGVGAFALWVLAASLTPRLPRVRG